MKWTTLVIKWLTLSFFTHTTLLFAFSLCQCSINYGHYCYLPFTEFYSNFSFLACGLFERSEHMIIFHWLVFIYKCSPGFVRLIVLCFQCFVIELTGQSILIAKPFNSLALSSIFSLISITLPPKLFFSFFFSQVSSSYNICRNFYKPI